MTRPAPSTAANPKRSSRPTRLLLRVVVDEPHPTDAARQVAVMNVLDAAVARRAESRDAAPVQGRP